MKKLGLSVTSLLVFLIAIEALLQLSSFFIKPKPLSIKTDTKKLRILCVGESTTAHRYENIPSWPELLEKRLIEKGIQVQVINKGIVGTNSSIVLSQFPQWLNEYKPHIVISMLGINDVFYFNHQVIQGDLQEVLLHSRLYKFLTLLVSQLSPVTKQVSIVEPQELELLKSLFTEADCLTGNRDNYPQTIKKYTEVIEFIDSFKIKTKKVMVGVEPKFVEYYLDSYTSLGIIHERNNNLAKSIQVFEEGVKRHPNNYLFYHSLALYFSKNGQMKESKKAKKKALELEKEFGSPITKRNLNKLVDLTMSASALPVLMQYPRLNTASLKRSISKASKVHFVDNSNSFEKLIEVKGFDKVFYDNFAGSFGHCTEICNELIVSNIISSELLKSLNSFKERQ